MKKNAKKAALKSAKKKSSKKSSTLKASSAKEGGEIISFIKRDHKPLKELISVLKDPDAKIVEKRPAFKKFQTLLLRHAHAEEQSLYVELKSRKDMRIEAIEGDVEHGLADGLMNKIETTNGAAPNDNDSWMAKVKVLAELVDHHIKEEEEEMLKTVGKEFDLEKRVEIGKEYERLYAELRRSEVEMPDKQSVQPRMSESIRDL